MFGDMTLTQLRASEAAYSVRVSCSLKNAVSWSSSRCCSSSTRVGRGGVKTGCHKALGGERAAEPFLLINISLLLDHAGLCGLMRRKKDNGKDICT